MKRLKFIIFAVLLALTLHSETSIDPENFITTLKKGYLGLVNGVIILTTDDNVAAGQYHFDSEAKFTTYQLPYTHEFDPFHKHWTPFINTAYNYANIDIFPPVGFKSEMNIVKLGGGIRYDHDPLSSLELSYALLYSNVHSWINKETDTYKENELLRPFFDAISGLTFTNWTNEFTIFGKYGVDVQGYIPYVKISYKGYSTLSHFYFEDGSDANSHTNLLHSFIGGITPEIVTIYEHHLLLEGYVGRTYFDGDDIHEVISGDYYNTYGFTLHFEKPSTSFYDGFEITSNWTDGFNFYGYNIGIGFNTKF